MTDSSFKELIDFIKRIPAVDTPVASGIYENRNWWIKFSIDIKHELAWHVVQELGHILNYLSLNERLPSSFYPVSPPPYMNGGPEEFLSWIIESNNPDFSPSNVKEWLEGRLPNPVDDIAEWKVED